MNDPTSVPCQKRIDTKHNQTIAYHFNQLSTDHRTKCSSTTTRKIGLAGGDLP